MLMSADQEGKVESSVNEDNTIQSDQLYENICRRVVGKCAFLLLAVQPAVSGKNASLTLLIRT